MLRKSKFGYNQTSKASTINRSQYILFLQYVFQLNNTEPNMLLHAHGNAVNIYIADSNIGRSTHNAEFPR
jgi:hypothetical protein